MTISAALHFRGKSSATWSTQSSHNFVSLKGKFQCRAVVASCSVPHLGLFVVASVPHSHVYTSKNHTSTHISQEIVQVEGLNTLRGSTHTASQEQEVSEQSEAFLVKDSIEGLVDHSEHCVKIVQSSRLAMTTGCNSKKERVAWNKGRHRSEETKEKIRARTRQALEDPKVRERIRKAREGTTQSSETKWKIKSTLLNFWELKKEAKRMQELCLREWEERIADTARRGSEGDAVYQWDSYDVLMNELTSSYKKMRIEKARTDRKSAEHKRKIAEAIRAKWADPDYSVRVRRGRDIHFSSRGCLFPDTDPDVNWSKWSVQSIGMGYTMKQLMDATPTDKPSESYKDPMVHHKLEKIKQMRFSRHLEENRKRIDIMEQAWLLMTEAKRAADLLEAANVKDENAIASLMEARRLIAEAECLFKNAGLRVDRPKTAHSEAESVEGATGSELSTAYSILDHSSFAFLE